MARLLRKFRCEIQTPQGRTESHEALSAVFPAGDGLVGVLGGRGPFVAAMGAGPLTINAADGQQFEYFVNGGFAQMDVDVLSILAEHYAVIEEMDPEQIWGEIERARELPQETPAEIARRDEALDVARTKFRLIQEHRKKPP